MTLDTFENPSPAAETSPIESFDNMEVKGLDDGKKTEEPVKKESDTKIREQKDFLGDNQTSTEHTSAKKVETKQDGTKPEEKSVDGKQPDGGDAAKKDAAVPTTEEKAKTITAKLGDTAYEVDPRAAIRVKIDGKYSNVPVSDLISNYSGKQSWDKKFSDLSTEKKNFEKEYKQYKSEFSKVESIMAETVKLLDNKEGDPWEGLLYFLDQTGRNPLEYRKRVMTRNLEELDKLQNMDEVERKLYWTEQEADYLRKRQESLHAKTVSERKLQEERQKVDQLREAHGISEEMFVDAHAELITFPGYEKPTPKQVVEYAVMKPHLTKAEELLKPYETEVDDSQVSGIIAEIAGCLKDGMTVEDINGILEEKLGVSEATKIVNEKLVTGKKVVDDRASSEKYRVGRKTEKPESFDDFEEYSPA